MCTRCKRVMKLMKIYQSVIFAVPHLLASNGKFIGDVGWELILCLLRGAVLKEMVVCKLSEASIRNSVNCY